jgi:hypothetical protein
MTTLVAWLATDSTGPASVYIASDSRISWSAPQGRWDAGRKLFACDTSPDIFGYCGDALFPVHALGQVVELADHGVLFMPGAGATERHAALVQCIKRSFSLRAAALDSGFSIVHVARDCEGMSSQFLVWRTGFSRSGAPSDNICATVEASEGGKSRRLVALGTGAESYVRETLRWSGSAQGGTSRGFFTALCDVLDRQDDPASGGAPQLVGLYRNGNGRSFGIVHKGTKYFHGLPVPELDAYGSVEWRDDAFQRINPQTLKLVRGAQRQVRPRFPSG